MLPLIGAQIWSIVEGYRVREREAYAEVERLARFISDDLAHVIDSGRSAMASMAALPDDQKSRWRGLLGGRWRDLGSISALHGVRRH
jgi:hypothetical protein